MLDFLLIAVLAAVFAFGGYLMRRLDAVLDSSPREQAALPAPDQNHLRIGFLDPLVSDSLSSSLDKYSRLYPNVSVSLFSGTEAELMREFRLHQLDMIFLPGNVSIPDMLHSETDALSLAHMPVVTQYGSLRIEPITEGALQQKVVWKKGERSSDADRFIRFLKADAPVWNAATAK